MGGWTREAGCACAPIMPSLSLGLGLSLSLSLSLSLDPEPELHLDPDPDPDPVPPLNIAQTTRRRRARGGPLSSVTRGRSHCLLRAAGRSTSSMRTSTSSPSPSLSACPSTRGIASRRRRWSTASSHTSTDDHRMRHLPLTSINDPRMCAHALVTPHPSLLTPQTSTPHSSHLIPSPDHNP